MPPRKSRSKRGTKKPMPIATAMQKEKDVEAPELVTATSAVEADRVEVAGPAVANTYELIESILLNLPARDLFRFQRVSKEWQSTIKRSQNLKRKMWLLPQGEPVNDPFFHHNALAPIVPIKLKGFGEPIRSFESATHLPITATFKGLHMYCDDPEKSGVSGKLEIHFSNNKSDYSKGPWQQVQLVQPPLKETWVWVRRDSGLRSKLSNEKGITLGDICAARHQLVEVLGRYGMWKKDDTVSTIVSLERTVPTCCDTMFEDHPLGFDANTYAPVYADNVGCGWRKAFQEEDG